MVDWRYPKSEIHSFVSKLGPIAVIPLKGKYRIIAEVTEDPEFHNIKEPTIAHMQAILHQRGHETAEFTHQHWGSTFGVQERIVSKYQYGNIVFLGDAAHVHSPVGGQGMNTGIQDAYNLAWKLALSIQQQTSKKLLLSYQQERRPVAVQILAMTSRFTKLFGGAGLAYQLFRKTILPLLMKVP